MHFSENTLLIFAPPKTINKRLLDSGQISFKTATWHKNMLDVGIEAQGIFCKRSKIIVLLSQIKCGILGVTSLNVF